MILLIHPTGNQNVRNVLAAVHGAKQLGLFATTFGGSREGAARWIPSFWSKEWNRRTYDLPSDLIWRRPYREFGRMVASRARWHSLVRHESGPFCIDAVYRDLDAALAAQLPRLAKSLHLTGVYGYEYACAETFTAAKALGLARFYDLPIAYWQTAHRLLEEEGQRLPEWEPTLLGTRDSVLKHERRTAELELADVVVCPSKFVADSVPLGARANKQVVVCPFGSPVQMPTRETAPPRAADRRLRVLFVGSMTQRKGLADVFTAVRSLNRTDVELVVMGSPVVELDFYRQQFAGFTYESTRPHGEVLSLMRSCDLLVLPSIVEGRALVMQEAMSQGLPLIVTPNTGGEDLIESGRTGFLVPIRAPDRIADRIAWFADNRPALREMAEEARRKAATYTWSAYGAAVLDACGLGLNQASHDLR